MPELRSSNLASAEYDVQTRALTITFKSGSAYTYSEVEQATYEGLLTAPSPGAYFAQHIKDQHSFTKG